MILAAIPAICMTLGMILFMPRGYEAAAQIGAALGLPVITTGSIIVGGVVQYVLALVGVYVMALIINALAPSFGGTQDQLKAFKVAAYYPTAALGRGGRSISFRCSALLALIGSASMRSTRSFSACRS